MAQPFAPRCARRERRECGNLRDRHVAQMLEIEKLAIENRRVSVIVL